MRVGTGYGDIIRSVLICCAVAANALCGGGVYSFPLIAPTLVEHLKLTQPQLTTIALAGMAGQYPFAAIAGIAIDRYGAWSCSFAASMLYSVGFGLFAREVAQAPADVTSASDGTFHRLVLYFGMIGLATVSSYFSLLFAATKSFPQYIGIASGTSMSIFGLSPLFLSLVASKLFTVPGQILDVSSYFTFLAIVTGSIHLVTAAIFRANQRFYSTIEEARSANLDTESAANGQEAEPLLANAAEESDDAPKDPVNVRVVPVKEPQEGSSLDLFKDPWFWVFASWISIIVGSAEMVISNLGSIVLSLPPSTSAGNATANVSSQVRLLSFFNTISRLLISPLADALAPVAAHLDGVWAFSRKRHTSRVAFMIATSLLLALTYAWLELGVRAQEQVWSLSVGTGIAYGSTFTLLPGILSSIWGLNNLGRNFGYISYAAFIGTTVFSYLYAFIAARHVPPGETACKGVRCWQSTFWISVGMAIVACIVSFVLWRRWRARV
ncbi:MFS general substrate transporter [Dichomitus squalens]|uniref:MFS general substrate transporter n=1 Tax=Dichomitus squalens TaxID=114155 RepID=A0A4Q9QD18_9APHY|nr:MFS general substrate transporter [Dichomitus squalens]